MKPKQSQRGSALIVILLILAVMVSIAATMSERIFVNFSRTESRLNHQQAYWYSIGVEALAKYGIKQSFEDDDTINLSQAWALEEQVYPLDYGTAQGKIVDKQACFNINALSNVQQNANSNEKPYLVSVWQKILEELNVSSYQAEVIADSTWEFLDGNNTSNTSYGVEDSYYEALQPSYMTPSSMIADASELRAVSEMDNQVMQMVEPIVCAIPWDDFRLNVNTVSAEGAVILAALYSPRLSLDDAASLISNRPYDGWASVDEFEKENAIAALDSSTKSKAKGYLTTDSRYFELDAQVVVNESRVRIRSLLFSQNRDDVSVIRRRFGGVIE